MKFACKHEYIIYDIFVLDTRSERDTHFKTVCKHCKNTHKFKLSDILTMLDYFTEENLISVALGETSPDDLIVSFDIKLSHNSSLVKSTNSVVLRQLFDYYSKDGFDLHQISHSLDLHGNTLDF